MKLVYDVLIFSQVCLSIYVVTYHNTQYNAMVMKNWTELTDNSRLLVKFTSNNYNTINTHLLNWWKIFYCWFITPCFNVIINHDIILKLIKQHTFIYLLNTYVFLIYHQDNYNNSRHHWKAETMILPSNSFFDIGFFALVRRASKTEVVVVLRVVATVVVVAVVVLGAAVVFLLVMEDVTAAPDRIVVVVTFAVCSLREWLWWRFGCTLICILMTSSHVVMLPSTSSGTAVG